MNKNNLIYIYVCVCIRYNTVKTKEATCIGYIGFLFPHEYSGEAHGAAMPSHEYECGK
jgi:hypothetical protein